jgi:hypothetical protein
MNIPFPFRRAAAAGAVAVLGLLSVGIASSAQAAGPTSVVFDASVTPLPGNVVSQVHLECSSDDHRASTPCVCARLPESHSAAHARGRSPWEVTGLCERAWIKRYWLLRLEVGIGQNAAI